MRRFQIRSRKWLRLNKSLRVIFYVACSLLVISSLMFYGRRNQYLFLSASKMNSNSTNRKTRDSSSSTQKVPNNESGNEVIVNAILQLQNGINNGNKTIMEEIFVLKKKIYEISDILNEQSNWKKYVELREQLLHAFPPVSNSQKERKDRNPHIILDSVEIDCNVHTRLIVLVSSNAPHFERRNVIRKMWGNHSMWTTKVTWKVIFVLGGTKNVEVLKKIQEEGEKYNDLMLEDILESFYQLSFKVMIGLHWVFTSFKFDFILKCDDDVFIEIDRVTSKLDNELKDKDYAGNVMKKQPVERNGRYILTKQEHENDHFDPYCSGGGFIISHGTIGKIIPLFNWKSPLKIDDAYIGELVFKAGAEAFHMDAAFCMWNNWCEYDKRCLISHPAKKIECMEFLQSKALIDNGKLVNNTIQNINDLYKPKTQLTTNKRSVET